MTPQILRLSDGGKAQFIESGAGEPVFLIHGVGMQSQVWEPQMTSLARRYRAIAVDMPGHGGSDPLPGAPVLPDFVAWASRAIEALGTGPVNLIGHSMGALIACGLAIEQPDQVRRLALLNVVHRRSLEARSAIQERARAIARGEDGVDATLARWFGPGDSLLRDKVAGWLRAADSRGYAQAYRVFAESDDVYADSLSKIRCPTLVLTGEDDANSTPSMTRLIARAIPRARAAAIAGHRHMVALTAPEAVLRELTAWLEDKEALAP